MAQIIKIGEPANDAERAAIAFLRDHTPRSWIVYHNFLLPRDGEWYEVDLAVLTPHAVYLVDAKGTRGRIEVEGSRWYPEGRASFVSPLLKLRTHASAFKGLITASAPGRRELADLYVSAAILLTSDDARLVDPGSRDAEDVTALRRSKLFFENVDRIPRRFSQNIASLLGVVRGAIEGKSKPRKAEVRFGNWIVSEKLGGTDQMTEYRGYNAYAGLSAGTVLLNVFHADALLPTAERAAQRKRIANAYQALSRLQHPGIVVARDFFPTEGEEQYVLVTDDVPGQPLYLHLKRPELALTLDQKLHIARELLDALAHAHRNGVVHRAISPDTILVGRDGRIKLTGFDYARTLTERSFTVAGELMRLDAAWFAPECHGRPAGFTDASDIYAVGLVLYVLFTGDPPFQNPTEQMQVQSIFPVKPSQLRSELPPAFDEWLQRLCAFEPSGRPSAADARQGLNAVTAASTPTPPLPAPAPSAPDDPPDWEKLPRGYRIDRKYVVEERLGSGAYGVVYRVFDSLADEIRALKLVIRDRASVVERLKLEYKRLLNLPPHPNVVRVVDAGFATESQPFVVFEYLDGFDVEEMISTRALSLTDCLHLGRDVAGALVHLHRNRVYHLDIKPRNLRWTNTGSKVMDFNVSVDAKEALSHGGGSRKWLPPDLDIADAATEDELADRDVYALGVTLYEAITGRYPWETASPPPGKPPLDPREISGLTDLVPDLASLMMRVIAPKRGDRFPSAEGLAAALAAIQEPRSTPAPVVPPDPSVSVENLVPPNTNPFVTHLLTLYSQSRRTNAGTRGLDAMGRLTYVETRLDEELLPEVMAGAFRLVLITGNAGDGKTAFLQQLAVEARHHGATGFATLANGCRFLLDDRSYVVNHDGSQDESGVVNDAVLDAFFAPYADAGAWPDDETRLIAINEGRLVDFLQERGSQFTRLAAIALRGLASGEPEDGVAVVNLNLRSVVADPEQNGESILERLLLRMTDESRWAACKSCDLHDKCYAYHNARTFQDPVAGPRVITRLKTLYALTHLRAQLHITLRDLRSALAYTIAGTRDCAEIHELYARGDQQEIAQGFYFNAWMGGEAPNADRLLTLLKGVDPGQGADARGDRRLDFVDPSEDRAIMAFDQRGAYDGHILSRMFQELPRSWVGKGGEHRLAQHRKFVAMTRRRAFFESRGDDRWKSMVPYRSAWKLLEWVSTAGVPSDGRDWTLRAINRGEGLSDLDRLGGSLALQVRQVAGGTIGNYRLFAPGSFHLEVIDAASRARFVEHTPSGILLRYDGGGNRAELRINLDIFEMLHRLNEGYRPTVEEVQGYYLALAVFKNVLSSVPYQEILLTVTGHDFHRVRREPDGRLRLEHMEVE